MKTLILKSRFTIGVLGFVGAFVGVSSFAENYSPQPKSLNPLEGSSSSGEEKILMSTVILAETPALTIRLTGEEVDGIIFALEYASDSTYTAQSRRFWAVRPREIRRLLVERLRAQVDPAEMTAEKILERES